MTRLTGTLQGPDHVRLMTWNVNGLRAAIRKGFPDHLEALQPDVVLLQEIRARPDQLPREWRAPDGWHVHWHPAQKAGYSGVAILSRVPFDSVTTGLTDADEDPEGRVLTIDLDGISLSSIYLPSGSSGEHRQAEKDRFLRRMRKWLTDRADSESPVIFAGDLNIAHTEQDIFYARSNEKTSGFLPHERRWFGRMLKSGWHDVLREQVGDTPGPYSWWSNRGRARELDRGWRIDYFICNSAARERCGRCWVHREGGLTVSDHAPVLLELA